MNRRGGSWWPAVCAAISLFVGGATLAEAPVPPSAPAKPGAAGSILVDYFLSIPGDRVDSLTTNPVFPQHSSYSELLKSFEFESEEQQYGSVTRGYVTPPATGKYVFLIAADDSGQLFLSTDESPEHKRLICECPTWSDPRQIDRYPQQKSQPIELTAGKRYYVEAIQKQEGGASHLSVGWQMPNGQRELPIPGSRLTPAGVAKPQGPVQINVTFNPGTKPATTPGVHKFPLDVTVEKNGQTWKMSYLIYLPKDYDKTKDKKPVLMFLCGNSHQGSDLEGILNEGPANFLTTIPKLADYWPFIGVFPQPPDNMRWDTPGMAEAVVGVLDGVLARYRADPDRVYLTGLSMGGKGTWLVAEAAPDRFAAIAPISAVEVKPDRTAEVLKYVPTWIICGGDDGGFTDGSKKMAQVLKAGGANVVINVVPQEGHGVWGRFYPEPRFYEWFLKHTRSAQQKAKSAATTQPAK